MTPDLPEDDKCQISICDQTHFTYCPHCKLFVCIEHLNEHYSYYKEEYRELLTNAQKEQTFYKPLIDEISHEKMRWIRFFDSQIEYFESADRDLVRRTEQNQIRPHDCADLRSHICQSSEKRAKIKNFLEQSQTSMDNFCQQSPNDFNDEIIGIKKEKSLLPSKIPKSSLIAQFSIDSEEIDDDNDNAAEEAATDLPIKQHSSAMQISDNSKSSSQMVASEQNSSENFEISTNSMQSDSEYVEDTEQDDSGSDPDFYAFHRSNLSRIGRRKSCLPPRSEVNKYQVEVCPLLDKLYGIDLEKHPLHHVPCTRSNIGSISLFTHLRIFHCLSSAASLRLVRYIMKNGCETNCDLFSTNDEPLVSILSKSFRGRCPLTRLGVFGLNRFHDIRLCDPNQTREDTGLLNHFVVFHCLSYSWANKLCNSMQAGDLDGKQILFKPDEPIKAEKWLTQRGKYLLEKRLLSGRIRKRQMSNKSACESK